MDQYVGLHRFCLGFNSPHLTRLTFRYARKDDDIFSFFSWGCRLQMQNFYPPFDWQTGTMISPNETNLVVGADTIRIGESIRHQSPSVSLHERTTLITSYKASKPIQI